MCLFVCVFVCLFVCLCICVWIVLPGMCCIYEGMLNDLYVSRPFSLLPQLRVATEPAFSTLTPIKSSPPSSHLLRSLFTAEDDAANLTPAKHQPSLALPSDYQQQQQHQQQQQQQQRQLPGFQQQPAPLQTTALYADPNPAEPAFQPNVGVATQEMSYSSSGSDSDSDSESDSDSSDSGDQSSDDEGNQIDAASTAAAASKQGDLPPPLPLPTPPTTAIATSVVPQHRKKGSSSASSLSSSTGFEQDTLLFNSGQSSGGFWGEGEFQFPHVSEGLPESVKPVPIETTDRQVSYGFDTSTQPFTAMATAVTAGEEEQGQSSGQGSRGVASPARGEQDQAPPPSLSHRKRKREFQPPPAPTKRTLKQIAGSYSGGGGRHFSISSSESSDSEDEEEEEEEEGEVSSPTRTAGASQSKGLIPLSSIKQEDSSYSSSSFAVQQSSSFQQVSESCALCVRIDLTLIVAECTPPVRT